MFLYLFLFFGLFFLWGGGLSYNQGRTWTYYGLIFKTVTGMFSCLFYMYNRSSFIKVESECHLCIFFSDLILLQIYGNHTLFCKRWYVLNFCVMSWWYYLNYIYIVGTAISVSCLVILIATVACCMNRPKRYAYTWKLILITFNSAYYSFQIKCFFTVKNSNNCVT